MVATLQLRESVESDLQLIELWVFRKSRHTERYYRQEARRFLGWFKKSLVQVTLADIQAFASLLVTKGLTSGSQGRSLAAIKSLLSFGNRLGVLPVNVGAAIRVSGSKKRLSERILDESQVHTMIALETNRRNRLILKLLYSGGLRVSEFCGLKWRDLQANQDAGQVTGFGKGFKTRVVLLTTSLWNELQALRDGSSSDASVFRSRKGQGHLDPSQVHRIVSTGAKRAGIEGNVSPHWLRHAHASHSLDRGAPIHLVQATLGHASVATTGKYLHARPADSSARYLAV